MLLGWHAIWIRFLAGAGPEGAHVFGRLAESILRFRRVVAPVLLLVVLAAVGGLTKLRVDFSFRGFVGSNDPAFASLGDFTDAWGSEDGVLLVLAQLDSSSTDTFTSRARMAQLEALMKALEAHDVVERAFGLPRLPRDAGSVGTLSFKPLLELADDSGAFGERLLADQLVVPTLLSADARATVMLVELAINSDDVLAFRPAVDAIREILGEHERDGLTLIGAGIPAVRADLVQTIQTEQTLFGTLTALIMGLVLCGLAAALPAGALLGLMGWSGVPMGILTQVYVTLVPVIAVADAIHILARFHAEARARGGDKALADDDQRREAIIAAYAEVGTACLFTSVTTAVGFLSLYVADMVVLHEFGIWAGLGILIAFLLLITGGPLALDRVRRLPPTQPERGGLEHQLEQLAAAVLARPALISLGTVALVVGLAFIAKDVDIDNRLSDTLGGEHATTRAGVVVDNKLGGQFSIHIDLKGATPGALLEPAALKGIEALEAAARALDGVRGVEGPALVLKELNRALTGSDAVPETRALADQLLFLADTGGETLPVLKEGGARGRIVVHVPDGGGNQMVRLGDALEAAAERTLEGTGVTTIVTGIPYVASRGFNRLSHELLLSLLSAVCFIALILGGLFRSLRVTLISLVPNLLPLLMCVALLTAIGWTLAPTVVVVFVVALGIAVDDTIHLLARLYEARRSMDDPDAALVAAVVHTGRPVLITSVMLTIGFAVNAISDYPVLLQFGTLGTAAFVTAVLADLIVLPALLKVLGGHKAAGA